MTLRPLLWSPFKTGFFCVRLSYAPLHQVSNCGLEVHKGFISEQVLLANIMCLLGWLSMEVNILVKFFIICSFMLCKCLVY